MNKLFSLLGIIALVGCSETPKNEEVADSAESQAVVMDDVYPYQAGAEFDVNEAISEEDLAARIIDFTGDSMQIAFSSEINASCENKGCWMKVGAGEDKEVLVRFKDYDFFVPLDAQGHKVTVNGYMYYDTITVEELRHYAMDANASEDSIQSITEPEITLAYEATGVYVE